MEQDRRIEQKEIVAGPPMTPTVNGSRLIRRGLDALEQRRTRTLHFPTERSVGELGTCPEGPHSYRNAEIFAEARGDVHFDGDAPLLLGIFNEVDDLSFLENLQPDDIQYLDFGNREISDNDLRHVAHLTGLLEITGFDAPRLTSVGVAYLRNLKQLREFDSPYFPMDDDCLRELANLTGLESLTARGHLTDAGIGHIRNLGRLRTLKISSFWHAVTEGGLEFIDELPDLEWLTIFHTVVTDRFIDRVIRLPKLKWLMLDTTAITDVGLHRLHQATNLAFIRFETTEASRSAVEALRAALPHCHVEINLRA